MARDADSKIKEEEEWESEDADDIAEQENPTEYDDPHGENTVAKASSDGAGILFGCLKCTKRKRHAGQPVCCGYKMIAVDFEAAKPAAGKSVGRKPVAKSGKPVKKP